MDHAFEHDLGACRHLQVRADAFRQLGLAAAQQAGELVFGKIVRHRRHRAEDGGRIAAEHHRDRKGLAGILQAMVAEIERAAAMGEPAHDHLVAADHLLAIDAEVLPALGRPARHRQPPGDQRRHIARPAGHHRQAREVDILAFPDDFLAGCGTDHLRRHVEHLLEHRQFLPGVAQSLGRLGLLEVGEQFAHFAQRGLPVSVGAHPQGHPLRRAEQVGQHRHLAAFRFLEQQRRPTGTQHAVGDLGHLQFRIDRHGNALQFALRGKAVDEFAQVVGSVHGSTFG